jgi:regulator of sigma E protease
MGEVMAGGAAERAGLRQGDVVRRVGDVPVHDGQQLRELIRAAGARAGRRRGLGMADRARRARAVAVRVQPERQVDKGQPVGRIGAYVGSLPEMVLVRRGSDGRPVGRRGSRVARCRRCRCGCWGACWWASCR